MPADSNDRVALVTGGSRGIGRETALRLALEGFAVAIGYVSNAAEADRVVTQITSGSGQALAIQLDVAEESSVQAAFSQVGGAFGGTDVVVNAAGLMSLATLVDFDLAVLDRMFRTNIRGTFVLNQQAARRVRPGGAIVNFSSSVLGRVLPTYTGYAASKAAVEAMTFILAHELRGRDITVNAVAPGPTVTDLFLEGKDEETLSRLANAVPLERLGVPADIAPVVAFLASGAGHWINGQTVRVNGGIV